MLYSIYNWKKFLKYLYNNEKNQAKNLLNKYGFQFKNQNELIKIEIYFHNENFYFIHPVNIF